jgi:hypothetical protein
MSDSLRSVQQLPSSGGQLSATVHHREPGSAPLGVVTLAELRRQIAKRTGEARQAARVARDHKSDIYYYGSVGVVAGLVRIARDFPSRPRARGRRESEKTSTEGEN